MSKNSESDENDKSDNDISGSSDSDDDSDQGTPAVPEINFQPQLSPTSQSKPDEDFRSKHPLFDAPEMIDDHDELNAQEKLSSDDETDKNDSSFENNQEQIYKDDNDNNDDHDTHGSSVLAMQDNTDFVQSNLIPQEISVPGSDDIPAWRKFALPPTPEPDDTEIDAAIQDQFSISKLLAQIRSS